MGIKNFLKKIKFNMNKEKDEKVLNSKKVDIVLDLRNICSLFSSYQPNIYSELRAEVIFSKTFIFNFKITIPLSGDKETLMSMVTVFTKNGIINNISSDSDNLYVDIFIDGFKLQNILNYSNDTELSRYLEMIKAIKECLLFLPLNNRYFVGNYKEFNDNAIIKDSYNGCLTTIEIDGEEFSILYRKFINFLKEENHYLYLDIYLSGMITSSVEDMEFIFLKTSELNTLIEKYNFEYENVLKELSESDDDMRPISIDELMEMYPDDIL